MTYSLVRTHRNDLLMQTVKIYLLALDVHQLVVVGYVLLDAPLPVRSVEGFGRKSRELTLGGLRA